MSKGIFFRITIHIVVYALVMLDLAWAGPGGFYLDKDNADLLSPSLQIRDIALKALFRRQEQALICKAAFLIHTRPFELLGDLGRIIMEKENIKIYLKVLDEDKKEVVDFEQALGQEENGLSALVPYYEIFRERKHGVFHIKKDHYFQLSFRLADGTSVIPRNAIIELFKNFFNNTIKRQDGSLIDVGFISDKLQDRPTFEPENILQLEALLGYIPFPVLPEKKPVRTSLLFDVSRDIDLDAVPETTNWSMYHLMVRAHTPDYKKYGRTQDLMIEQAI